MSTSSTSNSMSREKDAFTVLMSTTTTTNTTTPLLSQLSTSGTKFIVCPAGCGKRMLEKEVNTHLDHHCMELQQQQQQQQLECESHIDIVENSSTSNINSQHQTQGNSFSECSHVNDSNQKSLEQKQSEFSQQLFCNRNNNRNSSSKKRRRVACPVCQKSFPSATLLNLHLDQCVRDSTDSGNKCDSKDTLTSNVTIQEQPAPSSSSVSPKTIVAAKSRIAQSPDPNSAFATMMKQSKTLFGSRSSKDSNASLAPPVHVSFHMDESIRVQLRYPMTIETEWTPPVWSILMNVRDKYPMIVSDELDTNPLPQPISNKIEVTVSTDIPSSNNTNQSVRWVRQHTQLSVPVLKSILQKCIRRRKPLPAVRIAMELADKALGELIRRIPIIMIEDSMLHPDIHFIIWIMMAYSKDYQPSPKIMIRIFQIIYGIAACQWHDSYHSDSKNELPVTTLSSLFSATSNSDDENKDNKMTTSSNITEQSEAIKGPAPAVADFDDCTTFVWSMLVRAEYGGMKCDVQMLHQYAKLWWYRCMVQKYVPDNVIQQVRISNLSVAPTDPTTLTKDNPVEEKVLWSNLPTLIHAKVHLQGMDRVISLCNTGIDRLTMDDICIEGIDYHCSNIIPSLLSDHDLCGICYDLMILSSSSSTTTMSAADEQQQQEQRRMDLESILKTAIWNFSSKTNYRRSLCVITTSTNPNEGNDHERYTELWKELIATRVVQYQTKYIQQRLATKQN